MAHQNELTDWILKNSGPLDLRISELTWIRAVRPGMVDLSATVTLDGRDFVGRGADENEDRALGKAVCEAIERFVCYSHAISSTGVAGHFDEVLARKNAQLELIERASLFHYVENALPMKSVRSKDFNVSIGGKKASASLHLLEMTAPSGIAVVLCLAEGVTNGTAWGGILGLGCAESQEEATAKAEIECLRNVAALDETPMLPLSKNEFSKIEKPSAEDRRRLLFDFDYCSRLLEKLLGPIENPGPADFPQMQLDWTTLDLPQTIPANCPLRFFRCLDQSGQKSVDLEFVG